MQDILTQRRPERILAALGMVAAKDRKETVVMGHWKLLSDSP